MLLISALATLPTASDKDIDVAVAAARKAFNTTWGKNVTGFQRARLINKLADLIERDAQELAELETLNNGKPVKIARSVHRVLACFPRLLTTIHCPGTSTSAIASPACATMLAGPTRSLGRYVQFSYATLAS